MKEEISIALFAVAYREILNQEGAGESYLDIYTEEGLRLAGLRNSDVRMAKAGIFWVFDKNNPKEKSKVLAVKVDKHGEQIDSIPYNMQSKNGKNFNHKSAWNCLEKKITQNHPYNYYERGRVEIIKNKAVVFYPLQLDTPKVKQWVIDAFNLNVSYIHKIVFHVDGSKHYKPVRE